MQARTGIVEPMEILVAAILAASLLTAVAILLSRFVASFTAGLAARTRSRSLGAGTAEKAGERSCPLCSSVLAPGERVSSRLFPGKGDRIMHIFGCVHCWPATLSVPRICPVCGGALDPEGWVIARYFERPGAPGRGPGRRHVHVLGCTNCRKR
jgi:hypothetical protein